MPTDVAPGLCLQQSFELFEQLSQATQGWEMDFRQLDKTDSAFRLEQVSTSHMLYSRAYFGCRFHQLGGPVVGFRTFALHAADSSDYRWCGEAVNRHGLVVLPVDGQFESVSERGFDIFTLSLSNELLERTAQLQFQRPLSSFIGAQGEVCRRGGSSLQQLRTRLHALSHEIRGISSFVLGVRATRHFEQLLARLVLACLEQGDSKAPRIAPGKRMKTLAQALELIDHSPLRELAVSDLVIHTGVSRRTLENAFNDGLGVSPSAYLKAARLKSLNRDLLTHNKLNTSVSALLASHGFHHPGQLAADYRAMFGELPSATLRRNI